MKRLTITVTEEAASWARKQAAVQHTLPSKLVARMLEDEMRRAAGYRAAYRKWKTIGPIEGVDASKRLKRDELYDRG